MVRTVDKKHAYSSTVRTVLYKIKFTDPGIFIPGLMKSMYSFSFLKIYNLTNNTVKLSQPYQYFAFHF